MENEIWKPLVGYESAKKAFESQTEIKKYGTFRAMLSGHLKNKTSYKYY